LFIDPSAGQRKALHQKARPFDYRRRSFEILQTVKLARLEFTCLQRSFHYDINYRRCEPLDFYHICTQLLIERSGQIVKDRVAFPLRQSTSVCKLVFKKLNDSFISVLCRGHRLNDIASVFRVIIAVVRDELPVVFVRSKKTFFAFLYGYHAKLAIRISVELVRQEKLPPL